MQNTEIEVSVLKVGQLLLKRRKGEKEGMSRNAKKRKTEGFPRAKG